MRVLLPGLFLLVFTGIQAQTRPDSIRLVQQSLRYYDLEFTDPEIDSLLGNLNSYRNIYAGMHRVMPTNDIPFPFAFIPAPPGYNIPRNKRPIKWVLPLNTQMPANRSDLAFYSLPQLAALIRTKKISAVDLTRFFIDRLKKWGDTLECTITLTEELAMEQARQADADLRNGKYHGPLHGIPYGLKDLFAVKGYKTTWGTTPTKTR
jgi:hypothetical protein